MDQSRRNDIILIDIMCNYIRKNHKGLLQKHSPGRHPKKMLLKMYQQLMLPVVELKKLGPDVNDNSTKLSGIKPKVDADEQNDNSDEETDKTILTNGHFFAELSSVQNRKDGSEPLAKKHQFGRSSRRVNGRRLTKAQQNRAADKKQTKYNGHRACTKIYKFLKHHRYLQSKLLSTYKISKQKQVFRTVKANGERVRTSNVPPGDKLPCPASYHRGTKQKINGISDLQTSGQLINTESETILQGKGAQSANVDSGNTGSAGGGDTNIVPETDFSNMHKINAALEPKPNSNDEGADLKINKEHFSGKERDQFMSTITTLPQVPSKSSNISEISPRTNNKTVWECNRKPAFEIATNLISAAATYSSGSDVTTGTSYDMKVSGTPHEVQPKREPHDLVSDGSADDGDVVLDVINGLVDRVVDEEKLLWNNRRSCDDSRSISADLFKETNFGDNASLEHRLVELGVKSETGTGADVPTSAAVNGDNNDNNVQQSTNKKFNYCCNVTNHVRELMNDILITICAQCSRPGLVNGKTLAISKNDLLCMTPDNRVIQHKRNNDVDNIRRDPSDGTRPVHGTHNSSNKQDDYKLVMHNDSRSDESSPNAEETINCEVKNSLATDTSTHVFEIEANKALDTSEKRCFSTVSKTEFKDDGKKHFLEDQSNGRSNHQLNTVVDSVPNKDCEAESNVSRLLSDKENTAEQLCDVQPSLALGERLLKDSNEKRSSRENGSFVEETSFEQNSVPPKNDASPECSEGSFNDNFKINSSHEGETALEDTLPDIPPVTDDMLQESLWKEKPKVRRRRKKLKFSRRKIRTQTSTESAKQKKSGRSDINHALSTNQKRQQAKKRKLVQERRKLYPRRESIFYASDFLFKSETEESAPKKMRDKSPDEDFKSESVAEEKASKKKCNKKKIEKQEKGDMAKNCGSIPNNGLADSDGRLSVEFSKYNWFLEKYKVALKDENNDVDSAEVDRKPVKTKGRKKRLRKRIKLRIERSDSPDNEDGENDLVKKEGSKQEISNEPENKPNDRKQMLKVLSLSSCGTDKLPSADGGDMGDVKNRTSHNNTREGESYPERRENVSNPSHKLAAEPLMLTVDNDNDKPLDLSMKSVIALPLDLSLRAKKKASVEDVQRNAAAPSRSLFPTSSYACFNLPIPKSVENTTGEPTSQIPNAHDHKNPPVKAATRVHPPTLLGDAVLTRYQSTPLVSSIAHVHPSSLAINTTHVRQSTLPINATAPAPPPSLSVNPSKHVQTSTLPVHPATYMRSSSLAVNPSALPPPPVLRSSPSLACTAVSVASVKSVSIDSLQSELVIGSQRVVTHSARLPVQEQRCSPSLQASLSCSDGTGQRRQMPHLIESKIANYHVFDDKQLPAEAVDRLSNVYTRHSDTEPIINVLSDASYTSPSNGQAVGHFTQNTLYAQNPHCQPSYRYTPTSRFQEGNGQLSFNKAPPIVPYGGESGASTSGSDDWTQTRHFNRHGDHHLHQRQRSSQHQVQSCTTLYRSQSISTGGERQETRYAHQTSTKHNSAAVSTIKCQVCDNKATFLCSGCRKVAYYSRRCQCDAWNYHRRSCSVQTR